MVCLILQQPRPRNEPPSERVPTFVALHCSEGVRIEPALSHQLEGGLAEEALAAKSLHEAVPLLQSFEALLERGQLRVGPRVLRGAVPEGAEGNALDGHSDQIADQSGILTREFREPKDRIDVFRRARRVAGGHPRRRSRAQLHGHGLVNGQVG